MKTMQNMYEREFWVPSIKILIKLYNNTMPYLHKNREMINEAYLSQDPEPNTYVTLAGNWRFLREKSLGRFHLKLFFNFLGLL